VPCRGRVRLAVDIAIKPLSLTVATPNRRFNPFLTCSTNTQSTPIAAPAPQKTGFPAWAAALTAIGAITVAVALAGTVWRCVKERRKRQAEEDAAHSEPLSPHSVQSHPGM
jgi:uncharacterized protein HemX